ncbi:PAS domain S-box-containing protein/diguanylate cyclase (GGDEF) domain-containing protein [Thermoanaerobacter uzonensis DSM 18761]|uniref:Stage 0 sporulation protein A homolog n=1 Tax=Thermoanaerobacter uzonensis DSM 18761 TaxID=1123369 RepID=A0A1M4XC95_9THEO|nr:PAS domain S-box protein [Thermoanaerobacter uzonensis]SHE90812.1 PAS domain S-box-containing protein/diguanylate cyclase (GGDEF) domain-containing protein [Thermoanaerobacter uzonensis DSM 18761]
MEITFRNKILIVEDSKLNAQVTADILNKYGYETEIVTSGEEAVEKVLNNSKIPSLILMDIELKGAIDGIDAAKIILQHKDIPVLFLTANASREIVEKIKSVSAYGYVLKGVDEYVLISQIEMAFKLFETKIQLKKREELFRNMFENHDVAMILIDIQTGHIIDANKAACHFYGYSKETMMQIEIEDIIGISTIDGAQRCSEALKKGCNPCICLQQLVSGEKRLAEIYSSPVDYQGKTLMHLIIFDITEQWKAKRELEFYKNLFEDSLNEIYVFHPETLKFIAVNRGAKGNLGYTEEELEEMTPVDLKPEFTLQSFKELLEPLLKGEQKQIIFDTMHRRKDGSLYPVEIHLEPIEFDKEKVYVAFVIDITERQKIERELKERNEVLSTIMESAGDAIIMLDDSGKVTFWNPAAERILGYSKEEIIGKDLHMFMIQDMRLYEAYREAFKKFRSTGRGSVVGKTVEMKTRHKNGYEIDVELSLSAVRIKDGWYAIGIIRDISERKRFEELLYRQSITDPLTNIYNRRFFMQMLEQEIERVKRNKKFFSLIMFDLDHFKNVNDRFGHAAGDTVLKSVADTVKGRIRKTDYFARWGGEEFIILLPETSLNNAVELAEELREQISTIELQGIDRVTASFGVTEYRDTDTIDTVLIRVDNMLYEAKSAGRNCVKSE